MGSATLMLSQRNLVLQQRVDELVQRVSRLESENLLLKYKLDQNGGEMAPTGKRTRASKSSRPSSAKHLATGPIQIVYSPAPTVHFKTRHNDFKKTHPSAASHTPWEWREIAGIEKTLEKTVLTGQTVIKLDNLDLRPDLPLPNNREWDVSILREDEAEKKYEIIKETTELQDCEGRPALLFIKNGICQPWKQNETIGPQRELTDPLLFPSCKPD